MRQSHSRPQERTDTTTTYRVHGATTISIEDAEIAEEFSRTGLRVTAATEAAR